jgi:MoaA/NifB/PqqE/SkfB family radical SAM enzyme
MQTTKNLFFPGIHKPVYLLNFVTNRCNARCEHCFYWRELNKKQDEELTVQEHALFAKSLGPMLQITFTGGSPELRMDLPEIVNEYYMYCRPVNMTFCMLGYQTENVLMHVKKILEICKGQLITVSFSIDGIGKVHDDLRKLNGLFVREIKTIKELNVLRNTYSNLRIDVGTVIHGMNIQSVFETAKWITDNLKIDKFKPILVRGDTLNQRVKVAGCAKVYSKIVDESDKWIINKTQNRLKLTDKIIRAKELVQREIIVKTSQTGMSGIKCSGARETAVLYPNGDVAGCEMRNNILGNVRDYKYNIKNIWFSPNANIFRITTGKVKECNGCYHHCFISPAIFRTPDLIIKVMKQIIRIRN